MHENFEFVQKGLRLLLSPMAGFIGQEMNRVYKNEWWDEILSVLQYPRDLPSRGSYGELLDSLDIANCIRLIDWKWGDVFKTRLSPSCRAWARELMAVRNSTAHIGSQDLDQPMAERALDTMALLCSEIDSETAEEIRTIYQEVRAKANDAIRPSTAVYTGLEQPESESRRGALSEGSLLNRVGSDAVQKTTLTRKITYAGKTVVYPVYKVRLDSLYYNDQNDRIATWISRYEAENGKDSLTDLNMDIYNRVIESFIVDSNPDAIKKTQTNISLVGQREPGVTLADGRIVDGNRRFTCLRRMQRDTAEPIYFETVLMDMDIQEDRKQIKLLELAIQHGEEKKVDYDRIDYAIGTYRDIVQTRLLTAEEYAASTNEPVSDVRKRLELAEMISEFLKFLRLPEQYYIAREYQVFDLFQEMTLPLKKLSVSEKKQLKSIVFNNILMKAVSDQRKFIRDIRGLINNNTYEDYFEDQEKWAGIIAEKYNSCEVRSKEDADRFADENVEIAEELQLSLERALLRYRSVKLKSKPAEHVQKSISLLMEVDSRLFSRLDADEKDELKTELNRLIKIADDFRKNL